jgi:hypothetical protein
MVLMIHILIEYTLLVKNQIQPIFECNMQRSSCIMEQVIFEIFFLQRIRLQNTIYFLDVYFAEKIKQRIKEYIQVVVVGSIRVGSYLNNLQTILAPIHKFVNFATLF